MRLTPERVAGIRFEIWLEHYFKRCGCVDVKRDVEFHKSRYLYRQADIIFSKAIRGIDIIVIVEAKYSSNGPIKYDFRQGYKEKAGSQNPITNLIDEMVERQKFVGAYRSILVTNGRFDDKILREAPKHNIVLYDGNRLFTHYKYFGGKYDSLEQSINAIDIKRYDLRKKIYQIR